VIQTAELVANYTGQTGLLSSGASEGQKQPSAGAQITTIETRGGTKIVSKDGKEAEGQTALFDMKTNHVTMAGASGVTLKQGNNIATGTRLKMDLTKGEAQIENTNAPVAAPTPAQLSITAKPGVAPPSQPTGCPPGGGRTCIIIYPDQVKQAVEHQKVPAAGAPPVVVVRPKPEPQNSPSSVYRSN
jgi:lipopolysaccharide export system protein LptA